MAHTEELERLAKVRSLAAGGTARAIRKAARLSLNEIAHPIGVDQSTIYRWETGSRRPQGEAALRYLVVLESLLGASHG
ncbi:MAG: hypothetical protein QOJ67_2526 [Acidimicrobiaceae bacterium]|jgi:DNA-binding transcriptional regulator YiaG